MSYNNSNNDNTCILVSFVCFLRLSMMVRRRCAIVSVVAPRKQEAIGWHYLSNATDVCETTVKLTAGTRNPSPRPGQQRRHYYH